MLFKIQTMYLNWDITHNLGHNRLNLIYIGSKRKLWAIKVGPFCTPLTLKNF